MRNSESHKTSPRLAATDDEVAFLKSFGTDVAAAHALDLTRATVARIAAGFTCREGTLLVLRERIARYRAAHPEGST